MDAPAMITADDWGELEVPDPPRPQGKLQRMLRAAGMTNGVPDGEEGIWLPEKEAAERKRIMEHVRLWRENSGICQNSYDTIELKVNGETVFEPTWKFTELQNQIAYEALSRGATLRQTAILAHLNCDEVRSIAEQYHFDIF